MSSSSGLTIGPMEALSQVPPEILRYVIARSKINRHIEFDTGSALFQTADEYERLVANPVQDVKEMSKRQMVAAETQRGAVRLSQVNPESDPIDSVGGVSFRHLSMLAQIKSSDGDVWSSLNRSGHIIGDPSDSLKVRLARMRNWIDGPHFPEDAKLEIRSEIGDDARGEIGMTGINFLRKLEALLSECEWTDAGISESISEACESTEVSRKQGFASIYWAIIGRRHGPKASSLLFEMDRGDIVSLLGSS